MTTFIRTRLLNAYVALPLLICMILVTWSSPAASLVNKNRHHFSGQEMFKGLFFLEGQYTETIPELQTLRSKSNPKLVKPADRVKAQQIQNQVVANIEAEHPRFFTDFQSALESGNYVNVQNALKTGQSFAEKAVKQISQEINKQQFRTQSNIGTCIVIVYYCSTVYTLLMPVCPTMGIVVVYAAEMAQNGSSLLHEQIVDSICRQSAYAA